MYLENQKETGGEFGILRIPRRQAPLETFENQIRAKVCHREKKISIGRATKKRCRSTFRFEIGGSIAASATFARPRLFRGLFIHT